MYAVVVNIKLAPNARGEFMPLMRANAAATLAREIGCLQFDIATDKDRPEDVLLYELYQDRAAFETHLSTTHFKEFDASTARMIQEKTVCTYREVIQ